MFRTLGRFTAAHPWKICAGWLALAVTLTLLAPAWDRNTQDDDIRFLPDRCPSVRGYRLLEQAFPQDVYASKVIFCVERADAPLTCDDLALVDRVVADLDRLRADEPTLQINRVNSYRDPLVGKRLISADNHCTLIQVSLGTPYLALQTRTTVDRADALVRARLAEMGSDAPAVFATGPAGIGRDLVTAGASSLDHTTLATVILVVVILLAVYRAPALALVPLLTIGVAVWVALKVLALFTLIPGFHLVNISQIFAIVMLYGAGTDYCLFLISRYREELAGGHDRSTALARSIGGVGGALAASAGTVIVGLGMMGLAEFAKVRCGGPAIAVSLAIALAASLTLAPALLQILGRWVFWPGRIPIGNVVPIATGLWERLSRVVVARPVLVFCVSVAVLIPLALVGTKVRPNYRATGELSLASSSVQGLGAIQRHFTAGELGPITVLLESSMPWDGPEGQRIVGHLSQGFSRLDNVAEVRSLTQPLGTPLPPPAPEAPAVRLGAGLFKGVWQKVSDGFNDQVRKSSREHYQAKLSDESVQPRYVTRLDVVLKSDPFDAASLPALRTVEVWLDEELPHSTRGIADVRAEVYGVTINARDLADVTEADRVRINALVIAGIFLILLVLVRRPWLAAYLLATVLLSYFATLGATTLMAHWFGGRALGEVDWRVPFFLFTILVAVGEDYNILLVSRLMQERKRHGPVEATRRAVAQTGGTITSCGLIMAGTFATLMLAGLNTLVQIGFALAFGVLLDTFVVRPFLVPALAVWVWRGQEKAPEPRPCLLPSPNFGLRRAG